MKYLNPWFDRNNIHSRQYFETDAKPIKYKDYLIIPRINYGAGYNGNCFDILKDGKLISQYAGINGAKRFVDSII